MRLTRVGIALLTLGVAFALGGSLAQPVKAANTEGWVLLWELDETLEREGAVTKVEEFQIEERMSEVQWGGGCWGLTTDPGSQHLFAAAHVFNDDRIERIISRLPEHIGPGPPASVSRVCEPGGAGIAITGPLPPGNYTAVVELVGVGSVSWSLSGLPAG